eukprot:7381108-Prymnesium_polylepis.1
MLVLALARQSRDRKSEWRKNPLAPRLLVELMQESTHRQCAGEPDAGSVSRRVSNPADHACNFCWGTRSWSTRETPPLSPNVTWSA